MNGATNLACRHVRAAFRLEHAGVAVALSINNAGEIAGAYFDAGGSLIGFLFAEGRFVDFRVPDAGLTIPWSINERGEIAGIYAGGDGVYHGFVAETCGR